MPGDDGFLARWSKRKLEPERQEPTVTDADEKRATPEQSGQSAVPAISDEEAESLSDAELAERLGLPDPNGLKSGDDFKAFLAARVPARLRNLALRQLWRSNPVLANLDGLVDYADDYTAAASAGQVVSTTYEVGRGLRAHLDALERAAGEQNGETSPEVEPEPSAKAMEGTAKSLKEEQDSAVSGTTREEQDADSAGLGDGADPLPRDPGVARAKRRMVFRGPDDHEH